MSSLKFLKALSMVPRYLPLARLCQAIVDLSLLEPGEYQLCGTCTVRVGSSDCQRNSKLPEQLLCIVVSVVGSSIEHHNGVVLPGWVLFVELLDQFSDVEAEHLVVGVDLRKGVVELTFAVNGHNE